MLGLVDSLARRVVRRGLRRGLAEGSAAWIALGALAWLARLLLRPEQPRVATEQLRLGETLVVRHLPPPPTRRQRRKAARRGRARDDAPAPAGDAPRA